MTMARVDEKQVAVSRVYSRAMLDRAEAEGMGESLLQELQGLAKLVQEDAGFCNFVVSPLVEETDREVSLEKMFRGRASDLLVDSLQVLNRHGRLAMLETIVETYRLAFQEQHGMVDVYVTSAIPLNDSLMQGLVEATASMTGKKPKIIAAVDESLLGGIVVRVGDRKIDTSVVAGLRKMRHALEDRSARVIHASRSSDHG
jgi:F-type H+-transporting ATPase subunit delta